MRFTWIQAKTEEKYPKKKSKRTQNYESCLGRRNIFLGRKLARPGKKFVHYKFFKKCSLLEKIADSKINFAPK